MLPVSVQTKWSKWLEDVIVLEQVEVPRCYFSSLPDPTEKEIHAFCDASQNAYAGVIYIRTVTPSGTAHASLVMAKTLVAPRKTMTIPRSELNGALIVDRLCSYVKQVLKYRIQRTICWTDSSAALHWNRGIVGHYKQCVANRANEVNNLTKPQCWRCCPSDDNPTDLPYRGFTATPLISCDHWWNGPSWLSQPECQWPSDLKTKENIKEEDRIFSIMKVNSVDKIKSFIESGRFPSLRKLLPVSAYVLRFLKNAKGSPSEKTTGVKSAEELKEAKAL